MANLFGRSSTPNIFQRRAAASSHYAAPPGTAGTAKTTTPPHDAAPPETSRTAERTPDPQTPRPVHSEIRVDPALAAAPGEGAARQAEAAAENIDIYLFKNRHPPPLSGDRLKAFFYACVFILPLRTAVL